MSLPRTRVGARPASARPELLRAACAALLAIMLSSCAPGIQREAVGHGEGATAPRYSIVCVIHGDGDYLYHDSLGTAHAADEEALAAAVRMAERNPLAEVCIVHEKSDAGFLSLLGGRDGEFLYYRNGRLVTRESYRRKDGSARFDAQAELCRRSRAEQRGPVATAFLYYGHELLEPDHAGGESDRPFSTGELAEGMRKLTGDSTKFDLLVLSSCYSGTPHAIAALAPHARCIVASPDNIHLSYFDLDPLEHLEAGLQDGDVPAFARRFARHAFDRLARDIQTSVTVAVYDAERVQGFLRDVDSVRRALTSTGAAGRAVERCDCADLPAYVLPSMKAGVETFYRPARFGRSKHKTGHSGWECWGDEPAPPAGAL